MLRSTASLLAALSLVGCVADAGDEDKGFAEWWYDVAPVEITCGDETIVVQLGLGYDDEELASLESAMCGALQVADRGLDRLERMERGEATEDEIHRLRIWFSNDYRPLEDIDTAQIQRVFVSIAEGLRSETLWIRPGDDRLCAENTRGSVYVEEPGSADVRTCPEAFAAGMLVEDLVHESLHAYASLLDHGYAGPCLYYVPTGPSSGRIEVLDEATLLDNADTYSSWATDGNLMLRWGDRSAVTGACPPRR